MYFFLNFPRRQLPSTSLRIPLRAKHSRWSRRPCKFIFPWSPFRNSFRADIEAVISAFPTSFAMAFKYEEIFLQLSFCS
jgi:hypothetical protein